MTLSRRKLLLAGTPVVLSWPSLLAAAPPQNPRADALWIWETPSAQWGEAAAFAAAAGFTWVFLSLPPQDRARFINDPVGLNRALSVFDAQSLAVQAAAGDPKWATGDQPPRGLEQILSIVAATPLLRGLHLDVEPHALPEWKTADPTVRGRLAAGTLGLTAQARKALPEGKILGTVLHPSFAGAPINAGGDGDLATALIAVADEITVMAYRNTPEAVVAFAEKLLTRLDARPTPWRFGLTARGGQELDKISYDRMGWAKMRRDMEALSRLAAERPAGRLYCGGAVNAYLPLRAIIDR
jgi:hypothetical protein